MTLSDFFMKAGRGSQSKMAKALGCSKGYLSDIANGKKLPSRDFALSIERYTKRKVKAVTLLELRAA